jgi:peptide/nickel transport system permease protein
MRKRLWIKPTVWGAILGIIVLSTLLSPWIGPYDPDAIALTERLRPPIGLGGDARHPFGTDQLGRDVLSRVLAGGRISLLVGTLAVLMSSTMGTVFGLVGAYYGKWRDAVLTMLAEIQLSLPAILIIILVLGVLGPNIVTVAVVLALSDWVVYARTVRGRVLVEQSKDYVSAAKTVGANDPRILFRHLLPNVFPTLMVVATIQLGTMILLESSLAYLGLGVDRPIATWGRMVADGQPYLRQAWWTSTIPGVAIGMVVLSINMLGDGLRVLWKME